MPSIKAPHKGASSRPPHLGKVADEEGGPLAGRRFECVEPGSRAFHGKGERSGPLAGRQEAISACMAPAECGVNGHRQCKLHAICRTAVSLVQTRPRSNTFGAWIHHKHSGNDHCGGMYKLLKS